METITNNLNSKFVPEGRTTIIDGVEYKLFTNDRGPAVRVKDVDANEVVTLLNYPKPEMAQNAYRMAVAAARQCTAN